MPYLRFFFSNESWTSYFLYTFIHAWAAILCSTSRICPSWPRPRVRLSPFLACTCLVSTLFVLAHPAACCLSQRFIFNTCNPPLTTRWLVTFIQVNIMGAWYSIYNEHIYSSQHFFLYPLFTSGQASWPRTFMSGTVCTYPKSIPHVLFPSIEQRSKAGTWLCPATKYYTMSMWK
jgi:hypothetical protein